MCVSLAARQRRQASLARKVTTASDLTVEIRGIDDPTGRIDVYFGPSDRVVAVDPGDVFAPKEVRLDAVREHLLVNDKNVRVDGTVPLLLENSTRRLLM